MSKLRMHGWSLDERCPVCERMMAESQASKHFGDKWLEQKASEVPEWYADKKRRKPSKKLRLIQGGKKF